MKKIIRRIKEIVIILKLSLSFFISLFYKKHRLLLISERGTEARDNGYWLFKFIKERHPEIDVRFIISSNASDRAKLIKYKNCLITYGSFIHYIMLWRATDLISTHIQGYGTDLGFFQELNKRYYIFRNKNQISIKHGITKDYLPVLNNDISRLDKLVCGAKPEYDYVCKVNNNPPQVVCYTGFCRFDNLLDYTLKNQVLLMPTWRIGMDDSRFESSAFFNEYVNLLSDKSLAEILRANNLTLIFYPHYEIQKHLDSFKKNQLSSRIVIADKEHYDVQLLLKESKLLITDYSSVFFDFAYMKKPIIYYQFDYENYRMNQYSEGYFKYDDSFGPVCRTKTELINYVEKALKNNFVMQDQYAHKVDNYFPIRDKHNCERVYEMIMSCSIK